MRCKICKECKYPKERKTFYPEDSKGAPYCNADGKLTDEERKYLVRPYVKLEKVSPNWKPK